MPRPRLTRPSAAVLLVLRLEPQPVPVLTDRLALRGTFATEVEVRAQLLRLVRDQLATEGEAGGRPVYALAAGADAGLDRAWKLVRP